MRKLRAEQRLRGRAQNSGENFTAYSEDVVDLCRLINPSMSEADKIRQIMKGFEDDAFHMLVAKNPQTVADVIQLCQSYDELRKQRISTRRSNFDTTNILALTVRDDSVDHSSLLQQIQQFVREEVARQLSLVSCILKPTQSLAPSLRHAIQQQVSEALPIIAQCPMPHAQQHPPVSAPLTYAERQPGLGLPSPEIPGNHQAPSTWHDFLYARPRSLFCVPSHHLQTLGVLQTTGRSAISATFLAMSRAFAIAATSAHVTATEVLATLRA